MLGEAKELKDREGELPGKVGGLFFFVGVCLAPQVPRDLLCIVVRTEQTSPIRLKRACVKSRDETVARSSASYYRGQHDPDKKLSAVHGNNIPMHRYPGYRLSNSWRSLSLCKSVYVGSFLLSNKKKKKKRKMEVSRLGHLGPISDRS
ncbi:uncharacterized protein MCYG_00211 [Microsporum canis CBS 113480]|uniref:Uncharacterized protein n=1 Tax=Arthroderma otae (strain ATCC MYA-4605 / CBS 113480) TaxID=554155 RepID=C5FBY9_ARTOC|nr:uncharacterized protein MCYG_00211 [Microsporum canis CBS 113480]EEQ27323.1 predicted protein [Microsporum canis CBS 113480]